MKPLFTTQKEAPISPSASLRSFNPRPVQSVLEDGEDSCLSEDFLQLPASVVLRNDICVQRRQLDAVSRKVDKLELLTDQFGLQSQKMLRVFRNQKTLLKVQSE